MMGDAQRLRVDGVLRRRAIYDTPIAGTAFMAFDSLSRPWIPWHKRNACGHIEIPPW